MINFHSHCLNEQEIIGLSDVELEYKKKSSRVFCFVYFKNYPAKIASAWETGKVPHRLSFLKDHMELKNALKAGDIEAYKIYKAAATEEYILNQFFPKGRGKEKAPPTP